MNFIDYKQAFDTIWHEGLWQAMRNLVLEEQIIRLVKNNI